MRDRRLIVPCLAALFRIYSMTKPITAVAAMSIWEEGKFKLDDPVSRHLPEWADAFVMEKGEKIPVKKPLTARHLLTHSSGLTYGRVGLTSIEGVTLAMFSKKLAARPLKFQPGTSYNYGYSLDVLGAYLEAIEGQSLDAIFRERIFDQIGMDDTEFWVRNQEDLGRIAQVYSKRKGGELFPSRSSRELLDKPQRMMGGQGLVSTTEDYAMFCEMMAKGGTLDGKRVLKKKTIDLMLQNHLKDIGKSYGLGGAVDGKGGYVWGGAAGTGFWVNRKNESYGVYMVQAMGYKPKTYGVFKNLAKKAVTTAE